MKRIIALILSALMILGIFAGCGNTDSGKQTTAATGAGDDESIMREIVGTVVVNAAATITVSYGADGLVLNMEGRNDDGIELVESYEEEHFGSSCADVVNQIIRDCFVKNYMEYTNYVVVKLNKDSAQPGTNFLDGIKTAAQGALDTVESAAALVVIGQENLTADGYIDLVTAKVLVEKYLGVADIDNLDGTDTPIDGEYSFEVSNGIEVEQLIVDAETGAVFQGVIEDLEDPEETDPVEDPLEGEEPVIDEDIPSEDTE